MKLRRGNIERHPGLQTCAFRAQQAARPFDLQLKVPDILSGIGCMVKDSGRFPDTAGWGYAQFSYDPASDMYRPHEKFVGDAKCGHACHVAVEAKDYIFTAYQKR